MKKVIPLLALAVLAGCARPAAVAVEQAPAPVLSGTRTMEIVAAYDQANNEINSALDAGGLARIEAPPLRTGSEAWLRIVKQQGQTVPLITSSGTRFTVPSDGRWFVASANRVRGGVPSPRPTWTVFSEQNGQ